MLQAQPRSIWIPFWSRETPVPQVYFGERNHNPLQYSCLGSSMDKEAWQATVHGVAKSRTQLSNWTTIVYSGAFTMAFSPELKCFPGGSEGKASTCNARDPGSISGSGRSPGEGNGNPLQYSCLENSMDTGAWQATVHVTKKLISFFPD